MAEGDGKRSRGASFLKKSKWGKILKERDPDTTSTGAGPGRQNTFTLNEDVVDFLKPSTEKNMPKLDIAIAKRWPDAHEVRRAEEASPMPSHTTYTKPKRRKGLTVGFVKTLPEVIGEGGDEAPDPPREISRNKAMVQRSVSDRKPGSQDLGRQGPRSPPISQIRPAPVPVKEENNFIPKPIKRSQTSHDEISAPLQRKYGPPSTAEVEPRKPSLGRTPTGLSSYKTDHFGHTSPTDTPIDQQKPLVDGQGAENVWPNSRGIPAINTHIDATDSEQESASYVPYSQVTSDVPPKKSYPGLSPVDAISPVQQKRREMSVSEGMVLRRASMLINQGPEDGDESPPRTARDGSALQDPKASSLMQGNEYFSQPISNDSPGADITPDAPNPFNDPRYIKQQMKGKEGAAAPRVEEQPQSLRQTSRRAASEGASQLSGRDAHEQQNGSTFQDRSRGSAIRSPIPPSNDQRAPIGTGRQRSPLSEDHHARPVKPPAGDSIPSRPVPLPNKRSSQNIVLPVDLARDRSHPADTRDHLHGAGQYMHQGMTVEAKRTSAGMTSTSPSASHSRSSSRDGVSQHMLQPAGSGYQQNLSPQSAHHASQLYSQSTIDQGSKTSLLVPNRTGPSPTGPSPQHRGTSNDYFTASRSPSDQPAKSPLNQLRREESNRPGSAASNYSRQPSASPQPPERSNPAADAAYEDFAARVAHMRGVFRLTAEKEQPWDRCTPALWLRSALWWYLRGKSGLEVLLQQRKSQESPREMLHQAHVDLAKAWWIVSDPLERHDSARDLSPQSAGSADGSNSNLQQGISALGDHLRSLSLSMTKNKLLPPTQSLIQGQDTRIWLEYPRFTSDAAVALAGISKHSVVLDDQRQAVDPSTMLPLGDTRQTFCYGRFPVEAYVNAGESDSNRIGITCMLSVLRGRGDYQTSIAIASQNDLVNLLVLPKQDDKRGLAWSDVSWKASSSGLTLRLSRSFELSVRMQEKDFRAVWNLSEYARKVEKSLRAEPDEKLIHEARLSELQYADTSNSGAFPSEKVRGCSALIYERTVPYIDGSGTRKMHRGFRMLLITDPGHKTLSAVSHEMCRGSPLLFEYITDSAANGTTAMVIRIHEQSKQCKVLLVFPDSNTRQALFDVLNGVTVGPDETIVGKMTITGLNIESASQAQALAQSAHPALQALKWQRLGVTNNVSEDPNSRIPDTVESECLRIVARHGSGCITDRLNMGKGELRLRVPAVDKPLVQIVREPQEDLTMSIDTRNSPSQVVEGLTQLLHTAAQQMTIRTFTFAAMKDLYAFETAITGNVVRFDGIASTVGISRRRMVVPIYKKWEATNVRIQLVAKDGVVQLLAFMEDFSHADALCFQVKSTDTFETIKGDGKNKKWGVKMVDAKFSLPSREKGEQSEEEKLQRRFVNLEGLEYAEEHDDITIGFETEQERDGFAQALPAATSVSRGLTLKRRI